MSNTMLTCGVEKRTILKIQICFCFDSEAVKSDGGSRRVPSRSGQLPSRPPHRSVSR